MASFCTGVAGLDRVVQEHFGEELAWYSEIDSSACAVLETRFSGVPNIGDLTSRSPSLWGFTSWENVEPVDLICAGYPCQPFSQAGQRKGTDDVRHLWPYIAGALRVLRPSIVVLENVAGHRSLGFGEVLGDLATLGYDARWTSVRASDVGAPHRRDRVFIVARHTDKRSRPTIAAIPRRKIAEPIRDRHAATDPVRGGRETLRITQQQPRLESPHGHLADRRDSVRRFDFGTYATAVERWERILGRPAPHPTDDRRGLNAAFVEWMMGYPLGWVTDIVPNRAALRLLGNAVVPQQAAHALASLAVAA